eukprot:jgi/Botrbrau1/1460/Bobra.178_3s0018.1
MRICRIFLIVLAASSVNGQEHDPGQIPLKHEALGSPSQHPSPASSQGFEIPDVLNLVGLAFFAMMQLFPAKTSDTFPTVPLFALAPNSTQYTMKVCNRAAVKACLFSAPIGLPERFQGTWWMQGIGDQSVAINTGGVPYDAKSGAALVSPYSNQQWGYDASNSTRQGLFWTASGPALFNFALSVHLDYRVVFNEDITFAQIIASVNILGVGIVLPQSLFDFPMEWAGQDTWKRTSRLFGIIYSSLGEYNLRRIINGDGSKGYWFDKGWLTDRSGLPLAIGVQISPPR